MARQVEKKGASASHENRGAEGPDSVVNGFRLRRRTLRVRRLTAKRRRTQAEHPKPHVKKREDPAQPSSLQLSYTRSSSSPSRRASSAVKPLSTRSLARAAGCTTERSLARLRDADDVHAAILRSGNRSTSPAFSMRSIERVMVAGLASTAAASWRWDIGPLLASWLSEFHCAGVMP